MTLVLVKATRLIVAAFQTTAKTAISKNNTEKTLSMYKLNNFDCT